MKNIVIFGANSKIAKECIKLWNEKSNFYLVVRKKNQLDELLKKLSNKNEGFIKVIEADLNNIKLHNKIWNEIINDVEFKKIDLLFFAQGRLENQFNIQNNYELIKQNIKINVLSIISLITLATKVFERQKFGTIAVISSVAGDRGRASNYIYGSNKAFITSFLSGLRQRLSKFNVNVLTIKPGIINTPMTRDLKKGFLTASPQYAAKIIVKSIEKKKNIIYVPFFWYFIMLIIRLIPERYFKKLTL